MTPSEVAGRLILDGVATTCAAGCSVRGGRRGEWRRAAGGDEQRLFDLASLTKPVTAVAIVAAGINPATPLATLLPELARTASADASIEQLLAHRAGLRGHVALFEPLLRGAHVDVAQALRDAADARRPEAQGAAPSGGFAPVYSDLGYILAGAALARHAGTEDAGAAIQQLVLTPLGIDSMMGTIRALRPLRPLDAFVPTEDVPWRGGRIQGEVHDENAWALTGLGASGHAGLFGTLAAVLKFGESVVDSLASRGGPLGHLDLHALVTPRPGGSLRAGFDGKSADGSSAGSLAGDQAFGHLGFVGTSLWIDTEADSLVVLLTNRVFFGRDQLRIRSARPWAHDALWKHARDMSQYTP